jgi:prepilin-type N-terminal cleavage/methylation domain-containing protein
MHRSAARVRGFSLIELVIVVVIIAIIGAIAIPKMSRGSAGAADSSLLQDLATMRTAVDLYNTEHPTATLNTGMDVATALTSYSDGLGNTSPTKTATAIYGPYLKTVPTLPVGTNKGLTAVTTTGPAGTGAFAWYFDGVSFYANDPASDVDASGSAYNAY